MINRIVDLQTLLYEVRSQPLKKKDDLEAAIKSGIECLQRAKPVADLIEGHLQWHCTDLSVPEKDILRGLAVEKCLQALKVNILQLERLSQSVNYALPLWLSADKDYQKKGTGSPSSGTSTDKSAKLCPVINFELNLHALIRQCLENPWNTEDLKKIVLEDPYKGNIDVKSSDRILCWLELKEIAGKWHISDPNLIRIIEAVASQWTSTMPGIQLENRAISRKEGTLLVMQKSVSSL